MDMSSLSGGSQMSSGPKYRVKTTLSLLVTSYVSVAALIMLIVAFASPYWLSAHKHTYKNFVRLGKVIYCHQKEKININFVVILVFRFVGFLL